MKTLLTRIGHAFWYDEDWVTRWLSAALSSAGLILMNGGNVPGTEIVVPGVGELQFLGPWLVVGAMGINSMTSSLPQNPPPAP